MKILLIITSFLFFFIFFSFHGGDYAFGVIMVKELIVILVFEIVK